MPSEPGERTLVLSADTFELLEQFFHELNSLSVGIRNLEHQLNQLRDGDWSIPVQLVTADGDDLFPADHEVLP